MPVTPFPDLFFRPSSPPRIPRTTQFHSSYSWLISTHHCPCLAPIRMWQDQYDFFELFLHIYTYCFWFLLSTNLKLSLLAALLTQFIFAYRKKYLNGLRFSSPHQSDFRLHSSWHHSKNKHSQKGSLALSLTMNKTKSKNILAVSHTDILMIFIHNFFFLMY